MVSRGGGLSILAADFQITGSLRASGEIHIDGIVNGDVVADAITVGQGATIIGELTADRIVIAGTVHGKVTANTVALKKTARVHADLRCHQFDSAPGAVLELQGQDDIEATETPPEEPAP